MAITSRVITALEIMTKDGASKNWNMRTETWSVTRTALLELLRNGFFRIWINDNDNNNNNNNNNNNWEKKLEINNNIILFVLFFIFTYFFEDGDGESLFHF
jgi:hypothetical protein